VQPASPRVVELLNDALTFELTVTNTYFLHARMLDNWGFPRLGKVFYDLSIDEMKDADALINRILLFDGHPNVQRLNAITVGEDAHEMLRLALSSEVAAVAQFNASAEECHQLGDHGTASVFEEMVREEEVHADWFESQLDAIDRVGLQQYLARHIDPGAGPEGPSS
jgi:bacterioferritin